MDEILRLPDICLETLTDFVGELRLHDSVGRAVERLRIYSGALQVGLVRVYGAAPPLRLDDCVSEGPLLAADLAERFRNLRLRPECAHLEARTITATDPDAPQPVLELLAKHALSEALILPIEVEKGLVYALVVLGDVVNLTQDEDWERIVTIGRGFACAVRERQSKLATPAIAAIRSAS